jgi:hypothetical protein
VRFKAGGATGAVGVEDFFGCCGATVEAKATRSAKAAKTGTRSALVRGGVEMVRRNLFTLEGYLKKKTDAASILVIGGSVRKPER